MTQLKNLLLDDVLIRQFLVQNIPTISPVSKVLNF